MPVSRCLRVQYHRGNGGVAGGEARATLARSVPLEQLAAPGRLTELSGVGAAARHTTAAALVRQAQLEGETTVWVQPVGGPALPARRGGVWRRPRRPDRRAGADRARRGWAGPCGGTAAALRRLRAVRRGSQRAADLAGPEGDVRKAFSAAARRGVASSARRARPHAREPGRGVDAGGQRTGFAGADGRAAGRATAYPPSARYLRSAARDSKA
jgi:hypothetical protein